MNKYSSDTHYFHLNIIGYSGRPFVKDDGQPDVDAMHRTMIERHNSVVSPNDTYIHLGDFSFGPMEKGREILRQLNGKRKIIVMGNHDKSAQQLLQMGWDEAVKSMWLEDGGIKLFLRHAPSQEAYTDGPRWHLKFPPTEGQYFLHGHVHEMWKRRGPYINVGVDQWDFYPQTLTQLLSE